MHSKNIILSLALFCVIALAVSCKDSVKTKNTPDVVPPAGNSQCDEFSTEGFISRDIYRVIIVEPSDNNRSQSEIASNAQNRAISSLRKYVQSNGGTLSQKTEAEIRIIVQSGKIQNVKCSGSRTIYVFEINSTNIKSKVDSLTNVRK